ncbi:MAG: CehA/McbA family metallohydrolase [Firmicutes bacterium]|nr:CehA/McbA family metallohydrolase [Bacillota bacterium]
MGNIHIHSTYSDGAGTIDHIAQAAAKCGLDFIMITDHHTLAHLEEEGYRHGVLVLCGTEINDKKHHYLAFGITKEVAANDENPQAVIDAVNAQGGFGFIAHPFEKGSPLVLNGTTYPWVDWQVQGFTGIEVWNWCSQFRDGVQNVGQALYFAYLKPDVPITGPCEKAFARFDAITQTRKITAIAGSDAHDWHIRRGPLFRRIFPYEYLFGAANNCLLLPEPLAEDAATAKAQIYAALKRGRVYFVNRLAAEPEGFTFTVTDGQKTAFIGDTFPLKGGTKLQLFCPGKKGRHLQIKIKRNGQTWYETAASEVERKLTQAGTYRVEIRLKNKPWLYTNPIYVVDSI